MEKLMSNCLYIGDGIYFSINAYGQVVLQSSSDGLTADNTIYLEGQTWHSLLMVAEKRKDQIR